MNNKEWIEDHVLRVSDIEERVFKFFNQDSNGEFEQIIDHRDALKVAVEIHRNIILEQSLKAGHTITPSPLESIAISLRR